LRFSRSSFSELLVSSHLSLSSCAGDQPRAPFFLTNVSPAAAGADLGLYLHTIFNSSDQALQEGTGVRQGDARAAIMIGHTLATNLLSTLLIGVQAWWAVKLILVLFFCLNERAQEKTRRAVQLSQQEQRCHQG